MCWSQRDAAAMTKSLQTPGLSPYYAISQRKKPEGRNTVGARDLPYANATTLRYCHHAHLAKNQRDLGYLCNDLALGSCRIEERGRMLHVDLDCLIEYTKDRHNQQTPTLPGPSDLATNRIHQLAIVPDQVVQTARFYSDSQSSVKTAHRSWPQGQDPPTKTYPWRFYKFAGAHFVHFLLEVIGEARDAHGELRTRANITLLSKYLHDH